MKKYNYIPFRRLRRMYHRRWNWMRFARMAVPAALWFGGMWLLMMVALSLMLGMPI